MAEYTVTVRQGGKSFTLRSDGERSLLDCLRDAGFTGIHAPEPEFVVLQLRAVLDGVVLEDVVNIGDKVRVKVLEIDKMGRINLALREKLSK